MTWNPVASFQLITDWQITDVLPTGSYFQITHDNAPTGSLYALAQVELIEGGDKMRMCDSQVLAIDHRCVDIVRLVKPSYFTDRRLAIKRLPTPATVESELKRLLIPTILQPVNTVRYVRENQWAVDIQVSDYVDATTAVDLSPIQVKLDAISTKLNNLSVNTNTASSSPTSKTLTYQSDGDTNGVFYWLGTNYGKESWGNPYTAGRLGIFASSRLNGFPDVETLVDRQPSDYHTNSESTPYFTFDLGIKNSLVITKWSYKTRGGANVNVPDRLNLLVSNDNQNYTQIDSQSLTNTNQDSWNSFAVNGQSSGYRYFRFIYPKFGYFTAGEFEIYGKLITSS